MANEAKNISQLKPQHKVILAVAGLALLAGIFYYIKIMDIDAQIETSQAQYQKAESELKEYEKLTGDTKLEDMQKQYAVILKKSEENRKIIPEEPRVKELMVALEGDAIAAGLRVFSKKPEVALAYEGYTGYPIEYIVTGSFVNLAKFFLLISQPDRRLINIKNMKIEFDKKEDKEANRAKDAGDMLSLSDKQGKPKSTIKAEFVIEGYAFSVDPQAIDPTKKKRR